MAENGERSIVVDQQNHAMHQRTLPAGLPAAQGLYSPENEHDACGVGMICSIKNGCP